MNLDILKTHSAFQQQLRASAGGCARNRPAAEERADATVGERQEPQGFGMPRALRDLIPREANVVPSPGRWANPVGSNRPLCLPSHWGLWGASRASDGLCWEDWGSGWGTLVPVPPPPAPGQLSPFPAAPAPQRDKGQTPWCALGAAGDMLLLAGNSDLGCDFL